MSNYKIIPIFVPHLGCPNDCVFCNQKKITGIQTFDINKVKNNINEYLDIFKNYENIEIAFYGGSFTAIDRELQFSLLNIAKDLKEKNIIKSIRLSTRPDCINEYTLDYLRAYLVDAIELGVQSLNQNVLNNSKRGHSVKSVYNAAKLIKNYGFSLGLQQMVGLPGDSEEISINTTLDIIKLKPDFVRIYPTLVIKDTELEELYIEGKYIPFTIKEAVSIVKKLIMLYEFHNINIIRVGLQSSDNLKLGKDVIAGPLNDAFRELCESEKLYDIVTFSLNKTEDDYMEFISNNRIISLLVGQNASNKNKLKEFYNVRKIKFYNDNSYKNEIIVKTNNLEYVINYKDVLKEILKGWENVFKKH